MQMIIIRGMEEIKILITEDDPDHAELITEVLEETSNSKKTIILKKDGQEAIDFFKAMDNIDDEEIYSHVNLVILDLRLPKVDGMEVLKFLKNSPKYCSIPVIIFSTTSEIRTIITAYKIGVNSFMTKPISYEAFVDKIKSLEEYWLKSCALPVRV